MSMREGPTSSRCKVNQPQASWIRETTTTGSQRVQGNILDDDKVLKTLEDLKTEAGIITAKVCGDEGVWSEG